MRQEEKSRDRDRTSLLALDEITVEGLIDLCVPVVNGEIQYAFGALEGLDTAYGRTKDKNVQVSVRYVVVVDDEQADHRR